MLLDMDLDKQPKYVRDTAAALFALRPAWEEKAVVDDEGVLVTIPNGRDSPLTVRIDCHLHEVVVGFADIHNHFDTDFEHYVEKAIEYADEIMNETIISVSYWDGANWRGSLAASKGDNIQPDEDLGPVTNIRVRSFKGTYDQDAAVVDIRRT